MRSDRTRQVTHVGGRGAAAAGLAVLLLVISAPSAPASPSAETGQPVGTTRLISRGFEGKPAGDDSSSASVSDDGRYVAFHSRATDIVPSPLCDPEFGCNYLHDRVTGETVLVTVSASGKVPNDRISSPHISGDGRYVAYSSSATNLMPDDRNRKWDVFVYDRQMATTRLVSRNPAGDPADGHSYDGVVSQDGRYVIYQSNAKDLVPDHPGQSWDVWRTDLMTGTTILVSQRPNGRPPRGESTPGDLSADGQIVTYRSLAANIAPGDDNDKWDVFAFDAETGTTEVASRATDGSVAAGNSGGGSISDDGRFITFSCDAGDVVPPDSLGHYDVFRLDRVTGDMVLVSRGLDGGLANGSSGGSTISADGSLVAFSSAATNLVPDDEDGDVNGIFVADLVAGTTSELTAGRQGEPTDGWSSSPFISGSGNVVAFDSEATNLVRRDRNDADDVFVYRRH